MFSVDKFSVCTTITVMSVLKLLFFCSNAPGVNFLYLILYVTRGSMLVLKLRLINLLFFYQYNIICMGAFLAQWISALPQRNDPRVPHHCGPAHDGLLAPYRFISARGLSGSVNFRAMALH